jgi:hypothetical protein
MRSSKTGVMRSFEGGSTLTIGDLEVR